MSTTDPTHTTLSTACWNSDHHPDRCARSLADGDVCDCSCHQPDPTTAAPATPGQDDMRRERAILRWAADRLDAMQVFTGEESRTLLRGWADELSTTPPAGTECRP